MVYKFLKKSLPKDNLSPQFQKPQKSLNKTVENLV